MRKIEVNFGPNRVSTLVVDDGAIITVDGEEVRPGRLTHVVPGHHKVMVVHAEWKQGRGRPRDYLQLALLITDGPCADLRMVDRIVVNDRYQLDAMTPYARDKAVSLGVNVQSMRRVATEDIPMLFVGVERIANVAYENFRDVDYPNVRSYSTPVL